MGTSASSAGPGANVSFDPPWLNDIPVGGAGQVDGGASAPAEAPAEGVAPAERFRGARTSLGAFARNGDSGALARAAGHYSRKGMGGARNVAARMRTSTKAGAGLGSLLQATRERSDPQINQWMDALRATNPSAQTVIDAIVSRVLPEGGSVDEESAKDSMAQALSELMVLDPQVDLLTLQDAQIWTLMQLYLGHEACNRMYADIGETVLSAASISKAYELRDRVSDRERFFIALSYDLQVTGNLEKARQTGELWAQTYPRDPVPHGFLSGFISQGSGNYEKSIDEARKAIALDPDFTPGYSNLAFGFSYLDRFGEAERALQSASDRNLEIADILVLRYYIAFFKGDRAGMQRQVRLAQGKAGAEDWMSHHEALVLARSGHLRQAELMWKRAIGLAEQAEETERAAIFETATAVCEAVFGNALAARTHARAALELSKGRDVEYGAAFALGFSGDSSAAQRLTDDLETRFPEDTSVRFNYLPTLRAKVALDHQDPTKALDYLQMALPHDFAIPGAALFGFFGGLYPAYVGGEAHLAAHEGAKAAAEFKKVLSHRGIVFSDPISALAPLQIGRALVAAGDLTKAKTAYEDFLGLWRDADPEIPIFKQAKTEYAEFH